MQVLKLESPPPAQFDGNPIQFLHSQIMSNPPPVLEVVRNVVVATPPRAASAATSAVKTVELDMIAG
jgi:hypothetical protein